MMCFAADLDDNNVKTEKAVAVPITPEKKRKAKPKSIGLNMLADIIECEASGISGIVAFFEKPAQEDLPKNHITTSFYMVLPEPSPWKILESQPESTLTMTTTLKKESTISRCRNISQSHLGQRRHCHP
jgi:hypothetical protein